MKNIKFTPKKSQAIIIILIHSFQELVLSDSLVDSYILMIYFTSYFNFCSF